jgi:hypothetical protein
MELSGSAEQRSVLANAARQRVEEEFNIHDAVSPLFARLSKTLGHQEKASR